MSLQALGYVGIATDRLDDGSDYARGLLGMLSGNHVTMPGVCPWWDAAKAAAE